jgi:hypothetical protein
MDLTITISKDVTQCATKMKYMLTLGPHNSDYEDDCLLEGDANLATYSHTIS